MTHWSWTQHSRQSRAAHTSLWDAPPLQHHWHPGNFRQAPSDSDGAPSQADPRGTFQMLSIVVRDPSLDGTAPRTQCSVSSYQWRHPVATAGTRSCRMEDTRCASGRLPAKVPGCDWMSTSSSPWQRHYGYPWCHIGMRRSGNTTPWCDWKPGSSIWRQHCCKTRSGLPPALTCLCWS